MISQHATRLRPSKLGDTLDAKPDFDDSLTSRFEAVEFMGSGTFAEVWHVQERQSGTQYALKRLRANCRKDSTALTLLRNEGGTGKAVHSRHVLRVLAEYLDGPQPHLLLEWIPGETLQHLLDKQGRLPVGRALWIARQCAQGLDDLNRAGFTHGDLKPANILVTPLCEVKLIDLGFSRSSTTRTQENGDGIISGTAEYLAPENLSREGFSPLLKDVYSLGVTLFCMLAGRLPFEAGTTAEVVRLQREARPPSIRRWSADVPREVDAFVRRLLAKQPIRRQICLNTLLDELIALELSTFAGGW